MITIGDVELLFLLPTVFILFLVAVYHKSRKQMEQDLEWEKKKDKYKYRDWRY